ncbi:GSCFA domain-containing protein [Dyadobacter psychrotolerans]|uniref:GSCFA domain-containing protein n=1 Tax=Dyadobacter psychrotolerans TaxID=2541721 RepID=A0A4R5DQ29_9BACT|nr:GSCFA domain-containing protein [Dyadobacter psychrotolerans]TDE16452.1 GSCFA domain-containing protein [Dyadobacter psychrotolerans]
MKPIKLSTEVNINPPDWKVTHRSKILTIGSCFAEVLGQQLDNYKFPVMSNPFGTVFNPLTICKIIDSVLDEKAPHPGLYLENQDKICLHHDFHSSQWAADKSDLERLLLGKIKNTKKFLSEAEVLVVTLGTAYAYRHKATNTLVGNCHKVPSDRFVKELLHPDQIVIPFEQLFHKLKSFRRDLRIILTVSPVRHTRDTLTLNQVSKSTLRLVCHRLSEKFRQVDYFPSYEIMVDELRDYRFYEDDLIHPNALAEDYIFRIFTDAYIDQSAFGFMKEWESVRLLLNHRPQHGPTESQFKLLTAMKAKLSQMVSVTDVSAELAETERRIKEFPAHR